jgi:oligoendopeptidase F
MASEIFDRYLKLKGRVRYYDPGGHRLQPEDLHAVLRTGVPAERKAAWDQLCGGWAPCEAEGVDLLNEACRAKRAGCAQEFYDVQPALMLAPALAARPRLHAALEEKAALVGANGFRFCDMWARLPAAAGSETSFEDGLKELAALCDHVFAGGGDFVRAMQESGRIGFGAGNPHCTVPPGGGPVHVVLPESFRKLRPEDLPALAHELGHALHCDLTARLSPDKSYAIVFAEFFSQLLEELCWRRLRASAAPALKRQLELGRLEMETFDFLLMPMVYSLEEAVTQRARRGALALERITELENEACREWFGTPSNGARFWLRTARMFNPELAFDPFVYISGRALSVWLADKISKTGRLEKPALEALVLDTIDMDLKAWLQKYN